MHEHFVWQWTHLLTVLVLVLRPIPSHEGTALKHDPHD